MSLQPANSHDGTVCFHRTAGPPRHTPSHFASIAGESQEETECPRVAAPLPHREGEQTGERSLPPHLGKKTGKVLQGEGPGHTHGGRRKEMAEKPLHPSQTGWSSEMGRGQEGTLTTPTPAGVSEVEIPQKVQQGSCSAACSPEATRDGEMGCLPSDP